MLDRRSWFQRVIAEHVWLISATLVLLGVLGSVGLVRLDQHLLLRPTPDQLWLYGGSAEGAAGVLGAIAASAVTVAGVIFSANYVTLQLASSQYTPRVVQTLSRNWRFHLVIGAFLSSFIFSLLVLRSARVSSETHPVEFVPVISVSVAILLSLTCILLLVFFITYGMQSLSPSYFINSAAQETIDLLSRSSGMAEQLIDIEPVALERAEEPDWVLCAPASGFFQRIRFSQLVRIAEKFDLTVHLDAQIGYHYLRGEPLAQVWAGRDLTDQAKQLLEQSLVFGDDRTTDQDVDYGFRRVADIMLKALSPAINDPTTATYSLNVLANLVLLLADNHGYQHFLTDRRQILRLTWTMDVYNRSVVTAFGQLPSHGTQDLEFAVTVLMTMGRTAALLPETLRMPMMDQAAAFHRAALAATEPDRFAQDRIERASAWIGMLPVTETPG